MRRREFLRAGSVALGGAIAGCSGGAGPKTVAMTDALRFEPETVSVTPGSTVEWVTEGEIAHTVTAYQGEIPDGAEYFASGGFDTESAARENLEAGLVESGETYRHAFEVAGTYEYFCIPHEGSGMRGAVRVR